MRYSLSQPYAVLAIWLGACGSSPAPVPAPAAHRSPAVAAAPPPVLFNPDDTLPVTAQPNSADPGSHPAFLFGTTHRQTIDDFAYHPNGDRIAAVSRDGAVSIIDVPNGGIIASRRAWIRSPERPRVHWSRSGHRLLIAAQERFGARDMQLLNLTTGQWRAFARGSWEAPVIAWDSLPQLHADGRQLWWQGRVPDTGQLSTVLSTLSGESHTPLATTTNEIIVPNATGRTFVDANDSQVHLRSSASGEIIATVEVATVGAVTPRPTGGAYASVNDSGIAEVWDALTGKNLKTFTDEDVARTAWSENGNRLALFLANGVVVYDMMGRIAWRSTWESPPDPSNAILNHDGSALYVASETGLTHIAPESDPELLIEGGFADSQIRCAPDGSTIAISHGADLIIVDVRSDPAVVRHRVVGGHGEHSIWSLRWAPDGSLITQGRAGTEVWSDSGIVHSNCQTVAALSNAAGELELVCRVKADGNRTALMPFPNANAYALTEYREIELRLPTGRSIRIPMDGRQCNAGPCSELFSVDDRARWFLAGRDHRVDLFQVGPHHAQRVARLRAPDEEYGVFAVQTSPSGGAAAIIWLAQHNARTVLYDTRTRRTLARFETQTPRTGSPIEMTRDGTRLLVLTQPHIKIVSWRGAELGNFSHDITDGAARFTTDGTAIVAPRPDGGFKTWDADGNPRHQIPPMRTAVYGPSGQTFAHCNGDLVVVYDAVQDTRRVLGRCMPGDQLSLSPSGKILAINHGAFVRMYRLDRPQSIVLRTLRVREAVRRDVSFAADDLGHIQIDPEHVDYVRLRRRGPIASGTTRRVTTEDIQPDLLRQFYADQAETP